MPEEMKEQNAIITDASLSTADHGCLSSFIYLDYGGSGQGFGGYNLFNIGMKKKQGVQAAGIWISRVLEIADVTDWSKLKGKTIRVRASWGKVYAIGHIVRDDWFYPEKEFNDQP